jgi:glycosyltransferase involved in cell wall biosynthesis
MRILILAYTFPPVGGMSPRRILEFANECAARGHQVEILTVERPPRYPIHHGEAIDLAPGCHVNRIDLRRRRNSKEHAQSSGKHGNIRRTLEGLYRRSLKNIVFPDSTFPWLLPAWKAANSICQKWSADVVYSFAYPFSSHLLGYSLARKYGLRWVADYGDPWSLNPMWDVPRWRRSFDHYVESHLLKRASIVIVTTPETADAFRGGFPSLSLQVRVARCGYDKRAIAIAPASPREADCLRVVYTGVYGIGNRDFAPILKALSTMQDVPFELHIAGANAGSDQTDIQGVAAGLGFLDRVHLHGQVPLESSLALQKSANVLILWGWPGGIQVPAKIYEYFAIGTPVLHIRGDEHDPVTGLLERMRAGVSVDATASTVEGGLRQLWDQSRLQSPDRPRPDVTEFSWSYQAARMVDAVEEAHA